MRVKGKSLIRELVVSELVQETKNQVIPRKLYPFPLRRTPKERKRGMKRLGLLHKVVTVE